MISFSPTTPNPTANGLLGAVIYAGNGASRCNCLFAPYYPYAIAPRLGLAYQLDPKTVLRGGFGISYAPLVAVADRSFRFRHGLQLGHHSVARKRRRGRRDVQAAGLRPERAVRRALRSGLECGRRRRYPGRSRYRGSQHGTAVAGCSMEHLAAARSPSRPGRGSGFRRQPRRLGSEWQFARLLQCERRQPDQLRCRKSGDAGRARARRPHRREYPFAAEFHHHQRCRRGRRVQEALRQFPRFGLGAPEPAAISAIQRRRPVPGAAGRFLV